jgi:hypothetical protein
MGREWPPKVILVIVSSPLLSSIGVVAILEGTYIES